jgi:hypothetical protein
MKTIPLRDFQREGAKALGAGPSLEPWLLAGRDQAFILLPLSSGNRSAMIDLAEGMAAMMALREDQARAVEAGLDQMTMEEIEEEIRAARKAIRKRKRPA